MKLKKDGTPKLSGGKRTGAGSGGKRPGSGRKKTTPTDENTVVAELIFPALCEAFTADPGPYNNQYLSLELSKTEIRQAYGSLGLAIWLRTFKQEKIGGRDRNGVGYRTRWSLHLGEYEKVKQMLEVMGCSIKDLPEKVKDLPQASFALFQQRLANRVPRPMKPKVTEPVQRANFDLESDGLIDTKSHK